MIRMATSGTHTRPYSGVISRLKDSGLRPTRQRIALAKLLLESDNRHVTADELHEEAKSAGVSVSLATVYNALHQFTDAGLMREVVVESGRSYFDTNISDHHHFFHEDIGRLEDIPNDQVRVSELPDVPAGTTVSRVDVIVRISGLAD